MLMKVSALPLVVLSIYLYAISFATPSDDLLLFVSPNLVLSAIRVILVAMLVSIFFRQKFAHKETQIAYRAVGLTALGFGAMGILFNSLEYSLFDMVRPFDFIFFTGAGALLTQASLAHQGVARIVMPKLRKFSFKEFAFSPRSSRALNT